ncbi:MAG: hypothetical protein MUE69_29585 [Myxococcota bacterium]|jgi:hypothetical protein|nr:hypothetical protein [Myxococcota bacterium]
MRAAAVLPLLVSLTFACGNPSFDAGFDASVDAFVPDDAELDAFVPDDAGLDALVSDDGGEDAAFDVGTDAADDAGTGDAATMIPGFGTIVGACGRIAPELDTETPSFFVVRFDLADDPYDASDFDRLTAGAREILTDGTVGGSSELSEALSYEVLERCEGATMLLASEGEVTYSSPTSKRTDLVAQFDETIGVSVARAVIFPGTVPYTLAEAQRVIGGKLDDILDSSANVTSHAWDKQILVVMAWDDVAADRVREAWDGFSPERRADTVVYVVVTDGMDRNIYFNE